MSEIDVFKAASAESGPWWTWPVAVYLFLGGLAAGLMVLAGLAHLARPREERSDPFRLLLWLAPVLLTAGMLALWLDLEKRWNAPRFYLAFHPDAPMSWGAWILLAVYPAAILFALGQLPESARRRLSAFAFWERLEPVAGFAARERSLRRLAWANVAVGAALGIYTGVLLGVLSARPLWNSALLGPLFLVSGLSTAAALMLLFCVSPQERHAITRADAGLLAAELVLIGLFLAGAGTGAQAQREAASLLLGGSYAPAFWSLVVIGGIAVPLFAEGWESAGRRGSRWLVPLLVLAGGMALRWILVFAGQAAPRGLH